MRSTLARGNSVGQCGRSTDAAARAVATMQAVFEDKRYDWRHLPDLMSPWWLGISDEFATTTAARIRMMFKDLRALLWRYQVA